MKKAVYSLLIVIMAFMFFGCQEESEVNEVPDRSPELTDNPEQSSNNTDITAQSENVESDVPTVEVTLYLPDDNAESFETETVEIEDTPEAIVDKLVEEGALPEQCALLDFSTAEDYSTAVINMNNAFGEAVKSMGTSGERMLIGALVNTFLDRYDLDSVSVIIEGQTLETGHAVYDSELTFFE